MGTGMRDDYGGIYDERERRGGKMNTYITYIELNKCE